MFRRTTAAAQDAPLPITVLVGYLDSVTAKDAVAHARGFAARRYDAIETSWYAVAPFGDGFLYEVHQGGAGIGYLPAIISALTEDEVAAVWVPSGNRACQVTMRDGRPLGLLLSEPDSETLRQSGIEPLPRTGRMRLVSPKGTGFLVVGAAIFAAGAISLAAAAALNVGTVGIIASMTGGSVQLVEAMPHRQWPLVETRPAQDVYAAALRLQDGRWTVDWAAAPVPDVPDLPVEDLPIEALPTEKPTVPETEATPSAEQPEPVPGSADGGSSSGATEPSVEDVPSEAEPAEPRPAESQTKPPPIAEHPADEGARSPESGTPQPDSPSPSPERSEPR